MIRVLKLTGCAVVAFVFCYFVFTEAVVRYARLIGTTDATVGVVMWTFTFAWLCSSILLTWGFYKLVR